MDEDYRTEALAKSLHEAGREAVEKKKVVNPNTYPRFLEWNELAEHMKEGRRIQARYLLEHWHIYRKSYLSVEMAGK